mgnify:CR=1 FL=1
MNKQILSTVLMCVAIVWILFSDKLFKQQYVKIVKIICTIILLFVSLSYLF